MTTRRLGVGRVHTSDGLVEGDLLVEDGRVAGIVSATTGSDDIVAAGFVDLQVNGFAGHDFLSGVAAGLAGSRRAIAETGVTAFLPTLVSAPLDLVERRCREFAESVAAADDGGARVLGVHLEGPFLSEVQIGAHRREHLRTPAPGSLDGVLETGIVRLVTLAPELPGGCDLAAELAAHGVVVSAGHSDATAEEARRAFGAGVTMTTHHGNAMRRFHQRQVGLFGAALTDSRVFVSAIVDGFHLADDTVRLIAGAVGDRLLLVSDAVELAGSEETEGTLSDEVAIRIVDGAVRDSSGGLAGSALTMDTAVRNAVDVGVPVDQALGAASLAPRRALGLPAGPEIEGAVADLVVLDNSLSVRRVFVAGATAHER